MYILQIFFFQKILVLFVKYLQVIDGPELAYIHPYIELGLAIVFLSCGACKPEQT